MNKCVRPERISSLFGKNMFFFSYSNTRIGVFRNNSFLNYNQNKCARSIKTENTFTYVTRIGTYFHNALRIPTYTTKEFIQYFEITKILFKFIYNLRKITVWIRSRKESHDLTTKIRYLNNCYYLRFKLNKKLRLRKTLKENKQFKLFVVTKIKKNYN